MNGTAVDSAGGMGYDRKFADTTYSFFRHKLGKFQYILDLCVLNKCVLMVSLTNPIVAFVLKLLAIIFLEASCHGDYPAGK